MAVIVKTADQVEAHVTRNVENHVPGNAKFRHLHRLYGTSAAKAAAARRRAAERARRARTGGAFGNPTNPLPASYRERKAAKAAESRELRNRLRGGVHHKR